MAGQKELASEAIQNVPNGNYYIDVDPYKVTVTQTAKPKCPICGAAHDKSEHDD